MSMVAPVRKGEQMAASSYRLGGLGSDTISDATGQLHVHLSCPHLPALLHRAMTAATCLVTFSHRAECWEAAKDNPAIPFPDAVERKRAPPSAQEHLSFLCHPHRNVCGGSPSHPRGCGQGTDKARRPAACVLTRALQGPIHLDTGFQSRLGQFLGKP